MSKFWRIFYLLSRALSAALILIILETAEKQELTPGYIFIWYFLWVFLSVLAEKSVLNYYSDSPKDYREVHWKEKSFDIFILVLFALIIYVIYIVISEQYPFRIILLTPMVTN